MPPNAPQHTKQVTPADSSAPWDAMPPGIRGIYDGGGGSPDDDDPGDHKKKKRDSSNFSSFAEDADEGV